MSIGARKPRRRVLSELDRRAGGSWRRSALGMVLALALVMPLPAFALASGTDGSAAGATPLTTLSVHASLGGCGPRDRQLGCQINASWDTIAGADSYSASVTTPDGAVIEFGAVPAGHASVLVPYTGNGRYSVQITAWG